MGFSFVGPDVVLGADDGLVDGAADGAGDGVEVAQPLTRAEIRIIRITILIK